MMKREKEREREIERNIDNRDKEKDDLKRTEKYWCERNRKDVKKKRDRGENKAERDDR